MKPITYASDEEILCYHMAKPSFTLADEGLCSAFFVATETNRDFLLMRVGFDLSPVSLVGVHGLEIPSSGMDAPIPAKQKLC